MSSLESEIIELKSILRMQSLQIETLDKELFYANKELELLKKENNDLYDFNPSGLVTIDSNYIIQNLNFKAVRLLGINKNLLINKLFLNYISDTSKNTLKQTIQTVLREKIKQRCKIEIIKKKGQRLTVMMESILIEKTNSICIFLQPISPRLKLIQRNSYLEKTAHLLHQLFFTCNDALAASDTQFNLKIINNSFIEVFFKIIGVKINIGMNLNHILADFPGLKTKLINASQKALEGERTLITIENPINKNELYYCYELDIYSLDNHSSNKSEIIFQIRNITDLKLHERTLHKYQSAITISSRTSAMGEMVSALAHEINQPLTAISAYSRSCLYLMNHKFQNSDNPFLMPLEKIAIQAELAGEIIHNMNNFMREGSFSVEETDINQLIKDAIAILHYELLDYPLKISLNLGDELPKIMTNKTHIMQVILNLSRNSIEALQNNNIEEPELKIETRQDEDNIIIHVRDNGSGIPEEFKNKILKTYFTTKHKGTGIGLGICRTLIEEHGGKLSLQEHNGPGAWFTFTLPLPCNDLLIHDKN